MKPRLTLALAAWLSIFASAHAETDIHSAPLFAGAFQSVGFIYVWNLTATPVTVANPSLTDVGAGTTTALTGNTCTTAIPAHSSCHFYALISPNKAYGGSLSVVGAPADAVRGWFYLSGDGGVITVNNEMH